MSEEGEMLVVFGLDGDEGDPTVQMTTAGGNPGQKLINIVEPNKRCYVFSEIPFNYSNGIVVNWSEAMTCDADPAVNNQAIAAMLADPPLDMISSV